MDLFMSRIHPEDRQLLLDELQRLLDLQTPSEYDFDYRLCGRMAPLDGFYQRDVLCYSNQFARGNRLNGILLDIRREAGRAGEDHAQHRGPA